MTQLNKESLEVLLMILLDQTHESLRNAFSLASDGQTNQATAELRSMARDILAKLPDWELEDIAVERNNES